MDVASLWNCIFCSGFGAGREPECGYTKSTQKLIVVDIAPRKYNVDFHQNLLQKLYRLDLNDFVKRM